MNICRKARLFERKICCNSRYKENCISNTEEANIDIKEMLNFTNFSIY